MTKNNNYAIMLYWSKEDNYFLAEVPELPGCIADGNSYTAALNNVQVIIAEWMETARNPGREVPEVKGRLMNGDPGHQPLSGLYSPQ